MFLPDGSYRGVSAEEKRGETPLPEGYRLYKPGDMQSQGAASESQPFEYLSKDLLARLQLTLESQLSGWNEALGGGKEEYMSLKTAFNTVVFSMTFPIRNVAIYGRTR